MFSENSHLFARGLLSAMGRDVTPPETCLDAGGVPGYVMNQREGLLVGALT